MSERRSLLSRAAPLRFASLLLLAGVAAAAPATLPGLVWAEGTVDVRFEDGVQGGRVHHVLETARGRYTLSFTGRAPRALQRGSRVRVTGRQSGAVLALDGSGSVSTVSPAPLPDTLGEHTVTLLLVNFADSTTQPYTLADAASVLGQAGSFMQEGSSQQTWLSGAAHGWFTLPIAQTCDTGLIASHADQAAAAAGISVAAGDHVVYVFPRNSACMWSGQGTVGGSGGRIWINGRLELKTLAHEIGHNFGLYHSHALECDSAVTGTSCVSYDYGDTVDDMGNTNASHFNAFQKERLGWLNAAGLPPITTVTASGSYALAPYAGGSGVKALKILKSSDAVTGARTWYYVEFRQAIGHDAVLGSMPGGNVTAGVVVHTGRDDDINSSYLLDLTPNSSAYYDWNDPALVPGQVYSDDVAGITLTPTAVGSGGATVYVTLGNGSAGSGTGGTSTGTGGSATVTSLTVAASTDKAGYSAGQTVVAGATVSAGGSASKGAAVVFTITSPSGVATLVNASTDSAGKASASYRLPRKNARGVYQVKVQASSGSLAGSASTSFSVK